MSKKKKIGIGAAVVVVVLGVFAVLYFCTDIFEGKSYDYDMSEYVTVGNYKKLEYDKVSVSVSQSDIDAEIKTRLEAKATTEAKKSGTVKDGDTVNISYEGKIDGKTFDGGSNDSYDLTIGETNMIDGFTDGIIGMKVGETKSLNLKFPDPYESDTKLSGKAVVFKITVNTKNVTTTPKYDVAFIKANSDYDNKKDYEASVKKELLASKKQNAEAEINDALWNKVLAKSKVKKYPEKEKKEEIAKFKEKYKAYAKQYNVEWEEFLKSYMNNMTEKEFNKQAESYAEKLMKSKMVMYAIAKKEDIDVSGSEYDDYLDNLLKEAGFTESTFKDSYGQTIKEYGKENDFETYLLLDKVIEKVKSYGTEKK